MLRTHTCGELNKKHADKKVTLCGWIDSLRIQGKIGFLLLRDRYGVTQFFLNPKLAKEFGGLRKESVVQVTGKVQVRPANQIKKEMATGEIEVAADSIEVLSEAEELPLDLNIESSEETRLKYRYLDLRTPRMQKNVLLRHKVIKAIHDYMDSQDFLNIETPFLAKSTPEGARDYLVPARNFPGQFFALPQSPQLFKQLLMISNFDKYYQVVKCFRDEDLRADRQPEFTQLDIEMSFVEEEDIFSMVEGLVKKVFKDVLGKEIKTPFPRMSYEEVMKKYKTDKPDLRKNKDEFALLWVIDFPMFEYVKEEKRHQAMHHPFTSPRPEDLKFLDGDLAKAKARAYDLILNGYEIAGGSIRIHNSEIQGKIFKALNLSEKEAKHRFGFFLDALKYGTPPHGGIAFGLDRWIMLLAGEDSIKEVIAFPKNKEARDLMLDAPSDVREEQMKELKLKALK